MMRVFHFPDFVFLNVSQIDIKYLKIAYGSKWPACSYDIIAATSIIELTSSPFQLLVTL